MTRLAVKAAAALAGESATMRAKSVRPLFLRPALVAPNRKPRGSGNWDASDIVVDPFNLTGELGLGFEVSHPSAGRSERMGHGAFQLVNSIRPRINQAAAEVSEADGDLVSAKDMQDLPTSEFLELRRVNVARGDRVVLHDVDLTVRTGEHVAIMGPNGCGKSTLIMAMTCQVYPIVRPGMRVRIFGRERWDLTELRRHFGVVGAELPGERTAVTTGLDAVTAGFFSASTLWPNLHVTEEMRERSWEALERMEATHLAKQLVGEMSAGEKRRIVIARALVHRPKQLLLDEPSNALDLAAQRELRDTLRRLAQEGTGLVLVTHHLGDILPEIERVILMRSGRIVGDGPREELLTEERLSELFKARVRIGRDEEWLHSW
jgi:iron complex transport system ATP-binding protein